MQNTLGASYHSLTKETYGVYHSRARRFECGWRLSNLQTRRSCDGMMTDIPMSCFSHPRVLLNFLIRCGVVGEYSNQSTVPNFASGTTARQLATGAFKQLRSFFRSLPNGVQHLRSIIIHVGLICGRTEFAFNEALWLDLVRSLHRTGCSFLDHHEFGLRYHSVAIHFGQNTPC